MADETPKLKYTGWIMWLAIILLGIWIAFRFIVPNIPEWTQSSDAQVHKPSKTIKLKGRTHSFNTTSYPPIGRGIIEERDVLVRNRTIQWEAGDRVKISPDGKWPSEWKWGFDVNGVVYGKYEPNTIHSSPSISYIVLYGPAISRGKEYPYIIQGIRRNP